MSASPDTPQTPSTTDDTRKGTRPGSPKIDPTALAGTEHSLGQESVRDGRPTTDDSIVEAMDEETPAKPEPPDR